MTVLVVGLSHRTAPVNVLERVSVSHDDARKIVDELHRAEMISEVLLLSTCNRVEVYADVARFHPAVAEITSVLARHAGLEVSDLSDNLYVHFAEAAVEHLFTVASGLDSMVVGESQILGQLRAAYTSGIELDSVGSVLHELTQTALHVGKRVQSETGVHRAGASVVSVALDHAETSLRTTAGSDGLDGLVGRRVLVIGAGSMGALAASAIRRRGASELVIANRSLDRARELAARLEARAVPLADIAVELAEADIVLTSTGSTGLVVEADVVGDRSARPLIVLDIALPHDVDPSVALRPGVEYVDLESLRADGAMVSDTVVAAAAAVVAAELEAYLADQQRLAVAPTVTALRARANQVIDSELIRLDGRLPDLGPAQRREVAAAVRRAVEKVLHAPTVRVKELAAKPGGDQYAAALRELFDLDPAAAESVAAMKKATGELPGGAR